MHRSIQGFRCGAFGAVELLPACVFDTELEHGEHTSAAFELVDRQPRSLDEGVQTDRHPATGARLGVISVRRTTLQERRGRDPVPSQCRPSTFTLGRGLAHRQPHTTATPGRYPCCGTVRDRQRVHTSARQLCVEQFDDHRVVDAHGFADARVDVDAGRGVDRLCVVGFCGGNSGECGRDSGLPLTGGKRRNLVRNRLDSVTKCCFVRCGRRHAGVVRFFP